MHHILNRHRPGRNPGPFLFALIRGGGDQVGLRAGSQGDARESRTRSTRRRLSRCSTRARAASRTATSTVFCANASDGVMTAHPYLKGGLLQDIVGKKGFPLGKAIMETAAEGKIQSVTYWWPRPRTRRRSRSTRSTRRLGTRSAGSGPAQRQMVSDTFARWACSRNRARRPCSTRRAWVVEDGVDEVVRFAATRTGCRSCARSARRRSNWPSRSRYRCRNEHADADFRLGSPQAYTDYAG